MAVVVLLIIAVLWVVVLVPPLLRSRSEHRSGSSIGDFNYRLGVLGRTNGAAPVEQPPARGSRAARVLAPPPSPRFGPQRSGSAHAAKRRRDVLMILGCATGVSLLVAVVGGGGALWALQVLVDLLLVSYLALLGWYRRVQAERHAKVHYLAAPLPVPSPAPHRAPLRRTASR